MDLCGQVGIQIAVGGHVRQDRVCSTGQGHVRLYSEFVRQASSLFWALKDLYRACTDTQGHVKESCATIQVLTLADLLALCPLRSVHLQSVFGNTTAVITANTWMYRFV